MELLGEHSHLVEVEEVDQAGISPVTLALLQVPTSSVRLMIKTLYSKETINKYDILVRLIT
jgi:hypothetical protein